MFPLLKVLGFGPAIPGISPRHAQQGVFDGEISIVDVRNADEWTQSGTPCGSHRISLGDPQFSDKVIALAHETPGTTIAISCLTGMRSKAAAKLLRKRGIKNVQIVKGGIKAWKAGGLPVDL